LGIIKYFASLLALMEKSTILYKDLEKQLNLKVGGKVWIKEFQEHGLPHIRMLAYCLKLNVKSSH
jgi:hypothetical protein